jgi:hypothetical protein
LLLHFSLLILVKTNQLGYTVKFRAPKGRDLEEKFLQEHVKAALVTAGQYT